MNVYQRHQERCESTILVFEKKTCSRLVAESVLPSFSIPVTDTVFAAEGKAFICTAPVPNPPLSLLIR